MTRVGSSAAAYLGSAAGGCPGAFDLLTPQPNSPGIWRSEGWSWNAKDHGPNETILLVIQDKDAGVGISGISRPDVRRALRILTALNSA